MAFRSSKRELAGEIRVRVWGDELHFGNERGGGTEHDAGSTRIGNGRKTLRQIGRPTIASLSLTLGPGS